MNSMTTALATAGVALPSQMERLWKIIKDYPGISAKSAGEKAHIPMNSASSLICKMQDRGMVVVKEERRRMMIGRGYGQRWIKTFTIARGMTEYELLPEPAKGVAKSESNVAHAEPVVQLVTSQAVQPEAKMTQSFAEVFMMNHATMMNKLQALEPKLDLQNMQVSALLQTCAKHGVKISFS